MVATRQEMYLVSKQLRLQQARRVAICVLVNLIIGETQRTLETRMDAVFLSQNGEGTRGGKIAPLYKL